MVVGVNGVGKTTSIAKPRTVTAARPEGGAWCGRHVSCGAVDQLKVWGERVGVDVVAQGMSADPAPWRSAPFNRRGINADLVIIDTAGRCWRKVVMNELGKIKRVMSRCFPRRRTKSGWCWMNRRAKTPLNRPSATRGDGRDGKVLTKLDGTTKGGWCWRFQTTQRSMRFVGVGEGMEDLQDFHPMEFVDSLLPETLT